MSCAHHVDLREGQAWSARTPEGSRLRLLWGRVWLTQEGDARDRILAPGEVFRPDRAGRVAVQAFRDARLVLCVARRTG